MKKIRLLMSLVALCSVVTACSNKKDKTTPVNFEVPTEGLSTTEEITIKFYQTTSTSSAYGQTLVNYVAAFEEKYPNITVEMSTPGSYDNVRDQIKTELAVGEGPNVAFCYADHVALYNKAKAVVHLDNLIDSTIAEAKSGVIGLTDAQKSDFVEGYYNEGKAFGDGHMYTMPFLKSTEILYYNKTFFDANKLSVPTTWDEMETVLAKIKAIDPASVGLGYDADANWFITMCEQYKSGYTSAESPNFLFNNETNQKFAKRFREWYKKGYVETQKTYGDYTSGLFTSASDKKCYMCIGSSAGASHQWPTKVSFEVGVKPIPQVSETNKKAISQGPSMCIFAKDNAQEVLASWLFVKFLCTSVDFQAEYSMGSGYVPVIKSVKDNATYKAFLAGAGTTSSDALVAASANLCVDMASMYFVSPAFVGSSDARDAVGDLLYKCLIAENESDIDGLFKDAIAQCEYALL